MGERAHADDVDPCRGIPGNVAAGNIPRDLEGHPLPETPLDKRLDRLKNRIRCHVIEEDDISPGTGSHNRVTHHPDLYLDHPVEALLLRPPYRLREWHQRKVVILDQDHIREGVAVRVTSTEYHRLLIQRPEPRGCLPGCGDPDVWRETLHDIDRRPCPRRDPAHPPDDVERCPLNEEDCPCRTGEVEDDLPRGDRSAVSGPRADRDTEVFKERLRLGKAGDDPAILCPDRRPAGDVGDDRIGGDIAPRCILPDEPEKVFERDQHAHAPTAIIRSIARRARSMTSRERMISCSSHSSARRRSSRDIFFISTQIASGFS